VGLHPEDIACLLGLVIAFSTVVTLRKRLLIVVLTSMCVIFFSWVSVGVLTVRTNNRINHEFEAREARGEDLGREAAENDGVGDNALALVLGWVPAAAGTGAGVLCNLILIRSARRRTSSMQQIGASLL
jgi:hypothetical protein